MTIPHYPIDSSIPIPGDRGEGVPLDSLEVGESVQFLRSQRSAVQSNASRLKKRKGKKFTIRVVNETHARAWRVE